MQFYFRFVIGNFFVDGLISILQKNVTFVCVSLSILNYIFQQYIKYIGKINTVVHKKKMKIFIHTVHFFL